MIDLAVNRPETVELLARLSENYLVTKEVAIQAIEQKGLFRRSTSRR